MKKFILIFLIVFLIMIIGAGLYFLTFDINSYKSQIEKYASQAIGHDVKLIGQMSLKKSLTPTIELRDIEVSSGEGFESPNLALIKNAEIRLNLQALFQDIFQVDSIELQGVKVYLEKNKSGLNNWSVKKENKEKQPTSARPTLSKKVTKDIQVRVDSIVVKDMDINYSDFSSQVNEDIHFNELSLRHLINLDAAFTYKKEPFTMKGSIKNLLTVIKNPTSFNFTFDVTGYGAKSTISGDLRDLAKFNNMTLNIKSTGQNLQKTTQYFMDSSAVPAVDFNLQTALRISPQQVLAEGALKLLNGGITTSFSGEVKNRKTMETEGRISIQANDARFLKKYGIRPFTFESPFSLKNKKTLTFSNINMMADETDIDGQLTILMGKVPSLTGNLHSRYFNWENVLADKNETVEAKKSEANKKASEKLVISTKPLNLEALKKVNLDLQVLIDNLYIKDIIQKYPLIVATIRLQDGALNVAFNEGTQIAQGDVVGQLNLSLEQDGALNSNVKLVGQGLEIDQIKMLQEDIKEGMFHFNLNLTANGKSLHDLVSSLNGQFLMIAHESELFSRWLDLLPLNTLALGEKLIPRAEYERQFLYLKSAVLNLIIQDGVIYLDKKAAMETNLLNLVLDGTVNLKNEQLNVQLIPMAPKGKTSELANLMSQFVLIKGPFTKPQIQIDTLNTMKTIGAAMITGGVSIPAGQVLRKVSEDTSPCETALKGTRFQTIDDYFGRIPQNSTPSPVQISSEEKEPEEKPNAAVDFGMQLLKSLSNVLTQPIPPSGSTPR